MCQLSNSERKLPCPQKTRISLRQWRTKRVGLSLRSTRGAELDQTVSAMSGDVPGGSLETTWRAELSFDRLLDCTDERTKPSAMVGAFYTSRWSEAKPR